MINKFIKTAFAALSIAMLAATFLPTASYAMDEIELVVGSAGTKSKLFEAGNGISMASVIGANGVKVYNYGTKGDKDNLKRISKKKRAINLALVSAKGLAAASDKQKKAISGLIAIGKHKGDTILLIARNKAPKGVSKDAYAKALSSVIAAIKGGKGMKFAQKSWSGFAPAQADAAFKTAGVRLHKAAMM
jgi:hypothetical protein